MEFKRQLRNESSSFYDLTWSLQKWVTIKYVETNMYFFSCFGFSAWNCEIWFPRLPNNSNLFCLNDCKRQLIVILKVVKLLFQSFHKRDYQTSLSNDYFLLQEKWNFYYLDGESKMGSHSPLYNIYLHSCSFNFYFKLHILTLIAREKVLL